MDEHCKECVYVQNLSKDVIEVKNKIAMLEVELNAVKEKATINEVQTKMVFDMLKDIKASVERVSNKIDVIEQRPSKLQFSIITGVLVALITLAINLIIKQ